MGPSSDIEALTHVVRLLRDNGLAATRITVGSITLRLAVNPPSRGAEPPADEGEPTLSTKEREERDRQAYEELQYGASSGGLI